MSTVSKVIITTIIIVVVVLGGWWLIASMSNTGNNSSNDTTNGGGETSNGTNEPGESQEVAATIAYDGTNFTPATITVQTGDTIEVKNDSENVMYFASDKHPIHLDNSELNVGDIQPGSSAIITVTSQGTWGYHDHYNASAGGEIIVE